MLEQKKKTVIKMPLFLKVLLLIVAFGCFYYYSDYRKKQETIDYPLLHTFKGQVNGIVINKSSSYIYRNTFRIRLYGNQRFSIHDFGYIQVGDSLYRPANTDSLYIYRNEELLFNGWFNE